jgi:hypothetical protein
MNNIIKIIKGKLKIKQKFKREGKKNKIRKRERRGTGIGERMARLWK